ncbi:MULTISPECIES: ABC transporter ATP-binding protein [Vibrio]|uniref:ABC transporter ATP-binding protein n=1 Tax=Vibrio TaxID=662 RepID=UPI0006378B46|nr:MULTISPECIES: ABC transporter ATP-binding protein [Vibrio]MBE8574252.1 ABC transporter ATP-binding protein [Vibrio sp. OPT18]CDT12707.1 putative ABC-type dipeptide/oligopeptide/nickel transport system, ATPase component [Vibrio coralliirubri]CDT15723.1 putative ABC-type dipeptide/oligopeptide/nickel transport system, ATPase component [Vibrio coralliirubri]CDT74673.1 putative ABC-type dipeptide/oligopeptide/nickel transport system, ATPase component [Vibrio coralliirubri]CDT97449.1 putative AB
MDTEQTIVNSRKDVILSVRNLMKDFPLGQSSKNNMMRAVNDVSFELRKGEALAIVGESGSGKSTGARVLTRIYDKTAGDIEFKGEPLANYIKKHGELEYARQVQMIFQDPFGSLNPVHTIYHHIARPLLIHKRAEKDAIPQLVYELLDMVGLSPVKETAEKYPHELSGGQRQRVAIARAIAVSPEVILADEPISMLDVSVRLGILNLMADLKDKHGISFMYITHDIATARYFAEKTAVMYVGHMVEWGDSDNVTQNPHHPYSQLLLSAVPEVGNAGKRELGAKKGDIPLWKPTSKGCPFVTRCYHASDKCAQSMPSVTQVSSNHFVRCHHIPNK